MRTHNPSVFGNHFEVIQANSTELISHCQRLRFQTYCIEMNHLHEMQHEDMREFDEYDERSVHAALRHKTSGQYVATVRLVLYNRRQPFEQFPIEKLNILRRNERDMIWKVPRYRIAEISRFSVSKQFRRRAYEEQLVHGISDQISEAQRESDQRNYAQITINLFKAVFDLSYAHGITHWYALMEPSLIRLLSRVGIDFKAAGPLIDYYGMRQPCVVKAQDVVEGVLQKRTDIWSYITNDGKINFEEHNKVFDIAS